MLNEIIKTKGIILRKSPYKESSLITSLYTPDFGRIDFLIRGDLKISKKKTPTVDLFRILEVEYKDKESGLISPISFDLYEQYDSISMFPAKFKEACRYSTFLLQNSYSNIFSGISYSVFKNILKLYSNGKDIIHSDTLLKLAFLFEHGLLAESSDEKLNEKDTAHSKFIKTLLDYAVGKTENCPVLDENYWSRFSKWILNICKYHNLHLYE